MADFKKKQRVRFWIEKNTTCQILNCKKYNASDFVWKKIQRVRLWKMNFSSCQIFNKKFYKVSDYKLKNFIFFNLKFWPNPTTCTFQIAFLNITTYSHSLHYLRQLENSTHHRSNNTSCSRVFARHLDFWLCYGVRLYSLYGLDTCGNLLLLVNLLISILQLVLSRTCLTSFWRRLWWTETR